MKTLILSILLIGIIYPQGVEVVSVTHATVSGLSAYYQMKDRHYYKTGETELKEKYNSYWHTTGGIELGLSVALGGLMVYENYDEDIDWLGIGKDVVLFSAVRWLVRDGTYNMLNGNPFFHQSNNTTAKLEPFGMWYIKLSYLAFAIIWKYL